MPDATPTSLDHARALLTAYVEIEDTHTGPPPPRLQHAMEQVLDLPQEDSSAVLLEVVMLAGEAIRQLADSHDMAPQEVLRSLILDAGEQA